MVALQRLQREAERRHRTFQPLEQIHRHEGLQALFSSGQTQVAPFVARLRVVKIAVFLDPAGQQIGGRGIHRELEHGQLGENIVEAHHV